MQVGLLRRGGAAFVKLNKVGASTREALFTVLDSATFRRAVVGGCR